MSREVHDKFVEIKIHTAKCDDCNKHNTTIIFRCQTCGQQCCTPCWLRNGGDGRHRLNGGDQGLDGVGEVVGKRKREPVIVHGRRRVRRRTAKAAENGGDEDDEKEENGEGYAEAMATGRSKGKNINPRETAKASRQSFGDSTETERIAANSKKAPKQEAPPSFLSAAGRLHSRAVPSRIQAPGVSRLLPPPDTHALAVSYRATASNTARTRSSSYISPYPPSASDHDGIIALLRAAQYIEIDQFPLSSPTGASQSFSAPCDDKDEKEDENEGEQGCHDAQPGSPLFMTEDIDLRTQGEGGEAEAGHRQREDMMLQLDGAQDNFTGIDVDDEESRTGRVPDRRLDMEDGSDEETEYEDWSRTIGGLAPVGSGPSREADKTRDLRRDFSPITRSRRRIRRNKS